MFTERVRRPLLLFALIFFSVTALLVWLGERFCIPVACISGLLLLFVLCVPSLRRQAVLVIFLTAVLLSATLLYGYFLLRVQPLQELEDTDAAVSVRITALPQDGSKFYRAQVIESDVLPSGSLLSVCFTRPDTAPELYDVVRGNALLFLPSNGMRSAQADGVFLYARFSADTEYGTEPPPAFSKAVDTVRNAILSRIRQVLTGDEGALIAGICLGDKSSLSPKIQADFRRSGLSHILVVSGLHMSVLIGAFTVALRQCRLHRVMTGLLSLVILWFFMLLIGFSPSVIRAGILWHFIVIAGMLHTRADTLTSLSAALVLILLISPYAVGDVGFLLTFASTFGIVVLTPVLTAIISAVPLCRRHPVCGKILTVFCTPLAAMSCTAPISVLFFGYLPLLSPLSNFLAVWPVTVLMPLAAVATLMTFVPFCGGLAKALFLPAGLLAKWVLAVASTIGSFEFADVYIANPLILLLLFLCPPALYAAWRLYRRRGLRRVLALSAALLLFSVSCVTAISRKTVSLRLDTQRTGLTAVFENDGHRFAVISGEKHRDFVNAAAYFSRHGIRTLDCLIVTAGSHEVSASLSDLLESVPAETVIYAADNGDWTAGITGIQREPIADTATFTVFNTDSIRTVGGWWRVEVGDTCFLFAEPDASAELLPEEWQYAHLLVVREAVPQQLSAVTVQRVVLLGDADEKKLPPLPYTGQDAFLTTGRGDLIPADRYFLK